MKLIFVEKKYTGQELSISFIKANLAKQRKNSRKNENIRKFPYKLKAFFYRWWYPISGKYINDYT